MTPHYARATAAIGVDLARRWVVEEIVTASDCGFERDKGEHEHHNASIRK